MNGTVPVDDVKVNSLGFGKIRLSLYIFESVYRLSGHSIQKGLATGKGICAYVCIYLIYHTYIIYLVIILGKGMYIYRHMYIQ